MPELEAELFFSLGIEKPKHHRTTHTIWPCLFFQELYMEIWWVCWQDFAEKCHSSVVTIQLNLQKVSSLWLQSFDFRRRRPNSRHISRRYSWDYIWSGHSRKILCSCKLVLGSGHSRRILCSWRLALWTHWYQFFSVPVTSNVGILTMANTWATGIAEAGQIACQNDILLQTLHSVKTSGAFERFHRPVSLAYYVCWLDPEKAAGEMSFAGLSLCFWLFVELAPFTIIKCLASQMVAAPALMAVVAWCFTTALSPSEGPFPWREPKKFCSRVQPKSVRLRAHKMSQKGPFDLYCAEQPSVHCMTCSTGSWHTSVRCHNASRVNWNTAWWSWFLSLEMKTMDPVTVSSHSSCGHWYCGSNLQLDAELPVHDASGQHELHFEKCR